MERKKYAPYSIEVKIEDSKGRTVFKWHKSQNNLLLGLKRTNEFIYYKLGIDKIDKQRPGSKPDTNDINVKANEQKKINTVIEHAFGRIEPIEPIFGLKKGGERERK